LDKLSRPALVFLRAPSSPPRRALLCCVLQELLPNSIAPHSMHLPLPLCAGAARSFSCLRKPAALRS
jgi:hypothetical protein